MRVDVKQLFALFIVSFTITPNIFTLPGRRGFKPRLLSRLYIRTYADRANIEQFDPEK